ncbi:glucokinase [Nannochloropsis oceanica]
MALLYKGVTRVTAASARTMVPRRSMGIFHPLAMKPYQLPKTQKVYDTKAKPTYLKAPSDGVVTALGLGGLTLVFLRTMTGFGDMALGVNKVEVQ